MKWIFSYIFVHGVLIMCLNAVLRHHFDVRFDLYKRREELGGLQRKLKELEGHHGPEVEVQKSELLQTIKNTVSDLWKKDLDSLENALQVRKNLFVYFLV